MRHSIPAAPEAPKDVGKPKSSKQWLKYIMKGSDRGTLHNPKIVAQRSRFREKK